MRHWIYSESLSLLYIRRDYYSHTTGNKKRNDSKFTVLIILRPTTKMRKGIRETTAAHRWDLRVIVKRAHHLTPHRLHFRLPITRTCLNRVQTDIQLVCYCQRKFVGNFSTVDQQKKRKFNRRNCISYRAEGSSFKNEKKKKKQNKKPKTIKEEFFCLVKHFFCLSSYLSFVFVLLLTVARPIFAILFVSSRCPYQQQNRTTVSHH